MTPRILAHTKAASDGDRSATVVLSTRFHLAMAKRCSLSRRICLSKQRFWP